MAAENQAEENQKDSVLKQEKQQKQIVGKSKELFVYLD